MIASIYWELRQRKLAVFWWSVASVVLTVIIMALYPSIRDQAQDLNQVLNQLPAGLRGLKAGGEATVNVADPVDFLNSQLFYATLPIIWIILAITRGANILGRDEQEHTLELVLARPISRGKLLLAKAVAVILEFVIVAGATLIAILLTAPLFDIHVGSGALSLATIYTALFSLSFGAIAFTLQAVAGIGRRIAAATAVLISFGGYLIASLSGLTDWLAGPAKFVPYHYFTPDKILQGETVPGLIIYLIGIGIVSIIVSYFGFGRRDIA